MKMKDLKDRLTRLMATVMVALIVNAMSAYSLTFMRSVVKNFSSATTANALLLRNGQTVNYKIQNGVNPNFATVLLEKSCDGSNFKGLDVAVSTTNNSNGSIVQDTIPVEGCPGGKVWYRFRTSSYTSGISSTTLNEVDAVEGSFYNKQAESIFDLYSGGVKANGYSKIGLLSFTQTANAAMGAATEIPVVTSYATIVSTGLNVLVTATPSISTATLQGGTTSIADGTFLIITSTASQTITLQDEGTLTGSKLQLGASTRAISIYKVLTLIYSAVDGYWREKSYASN